MMNSGPNRVAFAVALTFALAAPVLAQTGEIPPPPEGAWSIPAVPANAATAAPNEVMPVDPTIVIGQLDNGLRYFLRENPYPAGRADLRLVVRTGSLMEDDDQLGLAHFVEHMAFNGTERYAKQELIASLESFGMQFGAHINAYTSFDETVYMLHIPTDREVIVDTAFEILEDWARGLTFEDEEIDKERGVVVEEWRLGLGVGSRVRDQQFPILFGGSRYAERPLIGTLESLEGFSHDAVRRFYADWYRPDLMAIIAVGDFNKQDMQRRIREGFADLTNPETERPRLVFDIPEHADTRFGMTTDSEAQVSSVSVYHKLPIRGQGTHSSYKQTITENLYSSMLNRRLRELAQQPEPPFLGAQASQGMIVPTREVYVLGAAVADGGLERGLEAVFAENARIAQQGFTATELNREKSTQLRGFERIYTEKATQPSRMFVEEFQRGFLENESIPGIDYEWALYQRFMPEITLDEVNSVGANWVLPRNRVVLVTAPDKPGLVLPSEADLLAALERAGDRPQMAYIDTTTNAPLLAITPDGGTIVDTAEFPDVDVTVWTLSNGVRVVLKPTEYRQDQVLLRAFSPGGTSLASDADYVAAMSAVPMVSASGFGTFSPRQITNMLADKVVNVNPWISQLAEGFSGVASPRDLETMFQLMFLKFNYPRADPGTFELITEQMRARMANDNATPEAVFQEEVQRTLSQNHFRRRPMNADLIDEMDLQKSYDFYLDRFADASDFTFVFVGKFDLATMEPLVARYLGGLPSTGREETWVDEGVTYPTGIIKKIVHKGIEPKSLTTIVFSGIPEHSTERGTEEDRQARIARSRAMAAMASVLEVRLRNVLREDLGGTYGVRVRESINRIPHPEYTVAVDFGSDPERVEELVGFVFAEIERLKESGPTQQEVDNVKEQLRRSFETASTQNSFWLGRLVGTFRDDVDPSDILDYPETLQAITMESVLEAANAYFDTGNYVQVTLLPEETRR